MRSVLERRALRHIARLIAKHEGPGDHKGTGTPQTVHAGQPGAEKGAISSPFGMVVMPDEMRLRMEERFAELEKEHGWDFSPDAVQGNYERIFDEAYRQNRDAFNAGMTWYSDARRWINERADEHGMDERQATAIIAVLSPRMEWQPNKDIGDAIMGALAEDLEIDGKPLSEMTPEEAARAIEGKSTAVSPVTGYKLRAMGDKIEKGIILYRGGDPDDVLRGPKVRSFYNNLWLPEDKTSFTFDTHMMRLVVDDPNVVGDYISKQIGSYPASKAKGKEWDWGSHPYFQDQAFVLAERKGILPHELQAVDWAHWKDNYAVARPRGIGGKQRKEGVVRGG